MAHPTPRIPVPDTAAPEPFSHAVPAQISRVEWEFAGSGTQELSIKGRDRLYVLREEGDCVFAARLSGLPSVGLVPITHVAKATPEMLSDRP